MTLQTTEEHSEEVQLGAFATGVHTGYKTCGSAAHLRNRPILSPRAGTQRFGHRVVLIQSASALQPLEGSD